MAPLTNGISSPSAPIQLAIPMPHAPQTCIHINLTLHAHCTLLFLASSDSNSPTAPTAMGSFVYAVPNARSPSSPPHATTLYGSGASAGQADFAARLARIVARKSGRPCYVGNAVSFAEAGRGGDVEEEMEGLRAVVGVVMGEVERVK